MNDGMGGKTDLRFLMLADTAKRLHCALPPDFEVGTDLSVFGERPRIGFILDRLSGLSAAADAARPVHVGPYLFDAADLTLTDAARTIRLTEKERDILLALLQAPGRRIERRDMLEKVWGYASGVETHTLETHVYRLRQKLEADPAKPALLLTDGDGYALA